MRFWQGVRKLAAAATVLLSCSRYGAEALTIDVNDPSSLKAAAETAKENMMVYYIGNQPGQIPGMLTNGYYWWECGAMMGQLIHNWQITGNDSLNDIISQALQWQAGENKDYKPKNWSVQLGNDDQVYWGFSVMDAAEYAFPDPPKESGLSWLGLAQAVFNTQATVWDNATCNGGLRWQIPPINPGYDYKNTMSNGGFFQLAARLARYTGNQTYADWANKALDWLLATPIIEQKDGRWTIWDGAHIEDNCTQTVPYQWTYNAGTLLMGSAYMYNYTNGSTLWANRIDTLLNASQLFFVQSLGTNPNSQMPPQGGQIMAEVTCETSATPTCNKDEPAFKAFLTRWLAITTQLVPYTTPRIMPLLQASAKAAAAVCTGTATNMRPGTVCGRRWYQTVYDGQNGVGEQMSAMSIFQNNLIGNVSAPLTAKKGGTSQSQPGAGSGGSTAGLMGGSEVVYTNPVSTGDKAGAYILTLLAQGLVVTGSSWMVVGELKTGWWKFGR